MTAFVVVKKKKQWRFIGFLSMNVLLKLFIPSWQMRLWEIDAEMTTRVFSNFKLNMQFIFKLTIYKRNNLNVFHKIRRQLCLCLTNKKAFPLFWYLLHSLLVEKRVWVQFIHWIRNKIVRLNLSKLHFEWFFWHAYYAPKHKHLISNVQLFEFPSFQIVQTIFDMCVAFER